MLNQIKKRWEAYIISALFVNTLYEYFYLFLQLPLDR